MEDFFSVQSLLEKFENIQMAAYRARPYHFHFYKIYR
jgi:hypothetical protein